MQDEGPQDIGYRYDAAIRAHANACVHIQVHVRKFVCASMYISYVALPVRFDGSGVGTRLPHRRLHGSCGSKRAFHLKACLDLHIGGMSRNALY